MYKNELSIFIPNSFLSESKDLKIRTYKVGILSRALAIFQNPPFGSQKKAKKGQDLKFVKRACQFMPDVLYSFHMASTEEFLIDFFKDNNLNISHIFHYNFPIPKIYEFHNKEKQNVDVIVIRAVLD